MGFDNILVMHNELKLVRSNCCQRFGMAAMISCGDLFVDKANNVIIGPALIDAYNLEQKAIYPRVIIDRRLIPMFHETTKSMLDDDDTIRLIPPALYSVDYPYIDFTSRLAMIMQKGKLEEVMKLMRKHLHQNGNLEKYIWLREHLKEAFEKEHNHLLFKENKTYKDKRRIKYVEKFLKELNEL